MQDIQDVVEHLVVGYLGLGTSGSLGQMGFNVSVEILLGDLLG